MTGSMTKTILNATTYDISITLYIRNGNIVDKEEYGSIYINLKAGENKEVAYGDIHNSFLNGYRCEANFRGKQVSYIERVNEPGCVLDKILNNETVLTVQNIDFGKSEAIICSNSGLS